jgi:putative ABC transport system permease protein
MNPWRLVRASLRRHWLTNLVFVLLIAVSVGLGVGLISQERALRKGSAAAADKFDLIVAAPGSQTQLTLTAVYLQPASVELIKGEVLAGILQEERAEFVAPLAFGDSHAGFPIIGTIAVFVEHLSGGLQQGRLFQTVNEVVIGSDVPLATGSHFSPGHGHGEEAGETVHGGTELEIVGRMQRTGTPWDRAIVGAVESVWRVHALPVGHDPNGPRADSIGPPFDPDYLPGVPALVIKPETFAAAYGLRNQYRTDQTMAFFPAEVLVQLYALMGDARAIMSTLTVITQILVAAGILAGIIALMKLFSRQFAVLRALGAPKAYIFVLIWCYVATLIIVGSLLGLAFGFVAAHVLSNYFSAETGIAMSAWLGWREVLTVGVFLVAGLLLAFIPGLAVYRRSVVEALSQ